MKDVVAGGIETGALSDDADVEAWWAPDADVTGRLAAAIAVACAAVPSVNARFQAARNRFETLPSVDIGIVVDTAAGWWFRFCAISATHRSRRIRRRLNELRTRVEDGPCAPSIMLTNFGQVAGRYAVLPVPPPLAAVIAAGQVSLQAVQREGHVSHHHMLPLSLCFDVRACGMGGAARFLAAMKADLAKPELPLSRGWHASADKSPAK